MLFKQLVSLSLLTETSRSPSPLPLLKPSVALFKQLQLKMSGAFLFNLEPKNICAPKEKSKMQWQRLGHGSCSLLQLQWLDWQGQKLPSCVLVANLSLRYWSPVILRGIKGVIDS